jgi:hypothetical protein
MMFQEKLKEKFRRQYCKRLFDPAVCEGYEGGERVHRNVKATYKRPLGR